ncbi:DUF3857 domain-containing protein [uncultured Maribacter sp.]|uniref:DUF3857 domain-containing protein n=1 Tax=uncultured Maribacter sp. TaxID=431308 RepID=UPI00261C0BE6|nr:DUF3857 domain-containing protein [uncultured Maribacter sp.]
MRIKFFLLLSITFTTFLFSQKKKGHPFGELLFSEKQLTTYDKDSTANAVVLYERGDNYFEIINGYVRLVKDYHVKIKILNKKGFDNGTISINLYHNNDSRESLKELKAITHNEGIKTILQQNKIYTKDLSERWKETTFTFPNIKEGSILEYKYKQISPYIFNFNGWEFQSNIPKIYSEFNAKIPGNYLYNRVLKGPLSLNTNDASIKKDCFYVDGYPEPADCEVLKYVMKDVPAFNEEEEYMLAASNYISKIEFELSEHRRFDGLNHKYTKSWKDVDKEFRTDKDFGRQLTKKNFFEKNVPTSLLTSEKDSLERAKKIYGFIQNHFTWDGKYSSYGRARVKEAFNSKKGNAWEINMSLINLLNAAGIPSKMMLISTRQSGLPKTTHPVMNDFNYILAKTEIKGETYLLDATNKYMPFGSLPFRALNHYGRVMDFKNESSWEKITPKHGSREVVIGEIKLNPTTKKTNGTLRIVNTGYRGISKHEEKNEINEEEYLNQLEESISDDFVITDYLFDEEKNTPLKTHEILTFELENSFKEKMVYLNPFLVKFFKKNPFLSEERNFPVDFGYKRRYTYMINIEKPLGYMVHELPNNKNIKFGDNYGLLRFSTQQNSNNIALSFDLTLNKTHLEAENYSALKELFKYVTSIQNNSLIIFKKAE